jgi:hypothetical protein
MSVDDNLFRGTVLQDIASTSGLLGSEDSSVRQAIADVLARVNLADCPEPGAAEEEQPSLQEKPSSQLPCLHKPPGSFLH